jgi:hypothetical protein
VDDRHQRNGHIQPPGPGAAKAAVDWLAEAARYAQDLKPKGRADLARRLGLPAAALDALPLVGWSGWAWTFPARDGAGRVVGLGTLDPAGRMKMIRGGRRGITIPVGWRDRSSALFIVEDVSDVLALHPSNTGGGNKLAVLLGDLPVDREVIVLGKNDRDNDGAWPGKDRAEKVAATLSAKVARTVHVAFPPDEYKDVREWVCDLIAGKGEAEDWSAIRQEVVGHCAARATVQPEPGNDRARYPRPRLARRGAVPPGIGPLAYRRG